MSQPLSHTQLISVLTRYIPPAVLRMLHHTMRPPSEPTTERFDSAILLADISGFTALTEKLAARGPVGAEELTQLLNRYFTRMIGILEAEGGEVVQFSGDALMASFPAAAHTQQTAMGQTPLQVCVQRAWQAANQMQDAMRDFASLSTSLGLVELGMKIAIGVGTVHSFSVGGVLQRWHYLIAGDPLRQVGEAEHHAQRGQIALSPEAQALFKAQPIPPQPLRLPTDFPAADASIEALRTHVPYAITYRLFANQADWLAELRRMTILFMGIGGLAYEAPEAVQPVQRWLQAVQEVIDRYEGSVNKLLVDDKGTIGIALFGGPPFSHADDPWRAVRCALELQQRAAAQNLRLSIGLATGQVFAGPVGSETRREYTVIGDTVNLSARLMQAAGAGHICADHATYHATQTLVEWQALEPQLMKGKAAAVRVYRPLGMQSAQHAPKDTQPLIGRNAEIAHIERALTESLAGQLRVVCLEGEIGLGKSRLIGELMRRTRDQGIVALAGNGDAIERQTSYNAWREVFASYFDLDHVGSRTTELTEATASAALQQGQREQVLMRLAEVAPHLLERAPLLNDLLGLGLPETALTEQLEPRLRQASLSALLVDLLALWVSERPLVLVLEDAEWLDSLSWQLALQVVRSLTDLPLLLALALRPLSELTPTHPYAEIRAGSQSRHLPLSALSADEIAALVAAQLAVDEIPPEVAQLIAQRANGNPFIAEELTLSLREQQVISVDNGECTLTGDLTALHVPETLHGLVLSSIDRLPPSEQLTLKIASVIGRTFGYATLHDIYQPNIAEPQLQSSLEQLIGHAFIHSVDAPAFMRSYAFKQAITQDVTYSTLLQTQYRALHERAAQWYESHQTSAQKELYPLLAYHWRQANVPEKELHYSVLAGAELAREYANQEAMSFLNRALQLSSAPSEQTKLLWLLLDVHDRIGNRNAQQNDLLQLQALIEGSDDTVQRARVSNAWADYYRNLSDYPSALTALQLAKTLAQQANDRAAEARSLTLWGRVLEHQGNYQDAQNYFEQALTIYRQINYQRGEANNLSNLSNINRYLGQYPTAREYALAALRIRRLLDDKAGEATSLNNLGLIAADQGDLQAAREYRLQALQTVRAIGDREGEAFSLGTLGNDCLTQGDYAAAQNHLQQALRLYRSLGERRREASCLNALGMIWRDVGDDGKAKQFFEQALALQLQTGSRSFVVAYTYLNLGFVLLPTDPSSAHDNYQRALALARDLKNRNAEGFALNYLAGFYEQAGDWVAARTHYEAALAIRHELKVTAASVEDRAGLARVALVQNAHGEARQQAEACATFMSTQGVDGIEFPLTVYLSCFDVFSALGAQTEARNVLAQAYRLLTQRAEAISDPALRAGMLQNVAANRRVIELWQSSTTHPHSNPQN